MREGPDVIVMRYIGNGWWAAGVPARDLTRADVDAQIAAGHTEAELLAFKPTLYERVSDALRPEADKE